MNPDELRGILEFLRAAERLKDETRTSWTSRGARESVAEHTWRLCLMAVILERELPELDFARLLKICVVHDLGEAIGGDISAPEQPREGKAADEREDLVRLLEPLPDGVRREILSLWDDYESARTAEARIAKALDKLETILQHNQGDNPPDFDYGFNLEYGREYTEGEPLIEEIREVLDRETREREARRRKSP